MITIWDKVLFKLRVSFYGLVIRNKVLLESSHHIETRIDEVVEVLEVHISVPLSYVLMRSSYNFGEMILCLRFHMPKKSRMSTFQWWTPLVGLYHSGRILSRW